MPDHGTTVRATRLTGGPLVLTETMPEVRSAVFSVWAPVGSRDEPTELYGTSHFLEHLLFKGTARRDAAEIAMAIDAVGGEANAVTNKEFTWYYARVRDTALPLAADLLCDMVTGARFDPDQVEAERRVILHEVAMTADDPATLVQEAFAEALFGDGPLGRPAIGTPAAISALTRDTIAGFHRDRYRRTDLTVAATGNIDHDTVVDLVVRGFADAPREPARAPRPRERPVLPDGPRVRIARRPVEQASVLLGLPGLPHGDDRRFALTVLGTALGGGLSSRLFQEIRERRGLAYAVGTHALSFTDAGYFAIYAGCAPEAVEELVRACRRQLTEVAEHGLTTSELDRSRDQATGRFVLHQEDTLSRVQRLALAELFEHEHLSDNEITDRLDAVTRDEVRDLAMELLAQPFSLAVAGPFDEDRDFVSALEDR